MQKWDSLNTHLLRLPFRQKPSSLCGNHGDVHYIASSGVLMGYLVKAWMNLVQLLLLQQESLQDRTEPFLESGTQCWQ